MKFDKANSNTITKPVIRTFDSSNVPANECLAYSNKAICSFLSPTETSSIGKNKKSRFDAYLKNISFGVIELNHYRTSPVRDVRSKTMLSSHPNSDYFLLRTLSGEGFLTQAGKELELKAGELALYDSAKEFTWQWDSDAEMQIARIPRSTFLRKLPDAGYMLASRISACSPFAMMLNNTFESALAVDSYNADFDVRRYGQSLIDMIATCIDLSLNARQSSKSDDALARAKKIINDNIGNSDFNLSYLARQMNASPSTVSRIFLAEGTTPIRWLWAKRLEAAYDLATLGSVRSVSQIALDCGFTDFAHFSRSFKSYFNVSPSELLLSKK